MFECSFLERTTRILTATPESRIATVYGTGTVLSLLTTLRTTKREPQQFTVLSLLNLLPTPRARW